MTRPSPLTSAEFASLVQDQAALVHAANDLEEALYGLGDLVEGPEGERCRDAAVELIGRLRDALFRWDQECLPRLDPQGCQAADSANEERSPE